MSTEKRKIEPIFVEIIDGITVSAIWNLKNQSKKDYQPVSVRVNCNRERWYYPTGYRVSFEDYEAIRTASGAKNPRAIARATIKQHFADVCLTIRRLIREEDFTLSNLAEAMKLPIKRDVGFTLLEYWTTFGEGKKSPKTQEQYRCAARSFYRAMGCHLVPIKDEFGKDTFKKTIVGKPTKMKPAEATAAVVARWEQFMDEECLSASTKSIYLRAFRAVMNSLVKEKAITKRPELTIKAGARRKQDFLTVPDIIKIRDYDGPSKLAADWWIILYLCNGSNLKDIASLQWSEDAIYGTEFSYVRAKIENKVPVVVNIPITAPLRELLNKYASAPNLGARVFPQILLDAETPQQIDYRVHDFNRQIRLGMQNVCAELGIRPVTASTARNSYITTLTWHGISDAFIDSMVGHVDSKNVLRGYQGVISPKKRMKLNNLLFVDPESESEE